MCIKTEVVTLPADGTRGNCFFVFKWRKTSTSGGRKLPFSKFCSETAGAVFRCFASLTLCPRLLFKVATVLPENIEMSLLKRFWEFCYVVFVFIFLSFYINMSFFGGGGCFCIVLTLYRIIATAVPCPNCILYHVYEINWDLMTFMVWCSHYALMGGTLVLRDKEAQFRGTNGGNFLIPVGHIHVTNKPERTCTHTQNGIFVCLSHAAWFSHCPLCCLGSAAHQYSSGVGDVA